MNETNKELVNVELFENGNGITVAIDGTIVTTCSNVQDLDEYLEDHSTLHGLCPLDYKFYNYIITDALLNEVQSFIAMQKEYERTHKDGD